MKTNIHWVLVVAWLSFWLAPAYGADPVKGYSATIGEKFGTGVTNVAAGFVEVPKTIYTSSMQDGLASGLTLGLFKGIANSVGRSVMGVSDMFTFMIPTKPMVQPSLIWQDFDRETTYSNTWELYNTR